MSTDFRRIVIVNRGEPAMRAINAVREYNREHGADLRAIALYTDPDRGAMFVREADEALSIGSAVFLDERDGRRKVGYLDYDRLERALKEADAEAVWVGWGFVAEHAEFVDLCDRLGVVFIGPSADVMRRLGDKITSKKLAEKAGVPVAGWSGGPVESVGDARAHAARLGYPVMIKATAGGGGRGIRRVLSDAQLDEAFETARSEALAGFGVGTVFMERLIEGARHIEVQIIGDGQGTTWALGVRDCTIQRRNQKVLEESPSPVLTPEEDRAVREAAVRLGDAAGYQNAGTVEFLFDPIGREFWFMEVNARLQVEHPVTEMTTGLDLVKLQLHVAGGGRLEGEPPTPSGHAIEVRLNAEDPDNNFAPAPGAVDLFRLPTGPGLRIDTGVEEGDAVASEFDSMIAKIISYGRDRAEALARLDRALAQTAVMIRDGTTNKGFLQSLVASPEVRRADFDVGWLDRMAADAVKPIDRYAQIALLQAAVDGYEEALALDKEQFRMSAARGRPEAPKGTGHTIDLRYQGEPYSLDVRRLDPTRYRIIADGHIVDVHLERMARAGARLTCGGATYRMLSVSHGTSLLVEVDGQPHRILCDEGGVVRSPSPAVVASVLVAEGDEVAVGDRLAVLEAMKMETSVRADYAGIVREVLVRGNVQVGTGTPLFVIDALETDVRVAPAQRADFSSLTTEVKVVSHSRCIHAFEDMRRLLLGYDVEAADLKQRVARHGVLCAEARRDDSLIQLEDEVLTIFVDIVSLFRRVPDDQDLEDLGRHSTREYLFDYLRDLDAKGAGLPDGFLAKLRRALAHYGVTSLDPGPELADSLFRIAKSHERMQDQITVVMAVLEDRLDRHDGQPPVTEGMSRELLDRLVAETRGRYPALHDLAQEVRYRTFDQPFLEGIHNAVYEKAAKHFAYLDINPDAPDRDERIRALVDTPQPLKTVMSSSFDHASPAGRQLLLEVMTRRYYRIRDLEDVRTFEIEGRPFAAGEYDYEGRRIHVVTTHSDFAGFAEAVEALCRHAMAMPVDHDVVADFYVWRPDAPGEPDEVMQHTRRILDECPGAGRLRRAVLAISSAAAGSGMGGVQHFTFRPSPDGYAEDEVYRGLHPMMGKRLEIWRMQNFTIERLPSVEDLYLFLGQAKENPNDRRLFAIGEVRDLTPLRDAGGRIVRIPEFERIFMEAMTAIRRFQAPLGPRERLHWNRALLHIWPPLDLGPDEFATLAARLAPATEGLGLEKVVVRARLVVPGRDELRESILEISNPLGRGLTLRLRPPTDRPLEPLDDYTQKVVRLRSRGLMYPYELVSILAPSRDDPAADLPPGEFVEHDLTDDYRLEPVERPFGGNTANVVVGTIRNFTDQYPEGMERVILIGDPSRGMGNLAEPECRRIIAALDLAEEKQVPVEWFAVSAGALISMDSGTENMDWIAAVLRRLVEFTQAGGEVNVVVIGINVGAQPYWNAEATMLMHTRGILVMTPEGAMVLTGKQALDYSGGVSAEDNQGIGGYERIMGPNGQAQYFAHDVRDACDILLRHYDHTYVAAGERFPRRIATTDPVDRDIRPYSHGNGFATVGEVFSDETNPGRKKPFDIRRIMHAVVDQDHEPSERWFGMEDAEVAVTWDAHVGGWPVALLGFESKPVPRLGFVPADGPDQWTAGTLFPQASRKIARAINAASGNRPLVVLANLSGFDGSPESMRTWQLEYGAEIGRAVVNFDGPIVFCVISRYHGGAFVVFSTTLNDNMEIAAVEGSYASVIGGAPAAAVVFAREVRRRVRADDRVVALEEEAAAATGAEKARLLSLLEEVTESVQSEMLGTVADEFDSIHSIHRALEVGSVNRIIPPEALRPYVIDAVERGIARELDHIGG